MLPTNFLTFAGFIAISTKFGYWGGGFTTDFVSTVFKFNFDLETGSTLGTGLSTALSIPTGFSHSGLAGYVAGGGA